MRVEKRLLKVGGGMGERLGRKKGSKESKNQFCLYVTLPQAIKTSRTEEGGTWSEMKMNSQNNTREYKMFSQGDIK